MNKFRNCYHIIQLQQPSLQEIMKRIGAVQMMPQMTQPSNQSSSDFSVEQIRRNESEQSDSPIKQQSPTISQQTVQQTAQQTVPQHNTQQTSSSQQIIKVVQAPPVDEAQVLARMDQLNQLLNTFYFYIVNEVLI